MFIILLIPNDKNQSLNIKHIIPVPTNIRGEHCEEILCQPLINSLFFFSESLLLHYVYFIAF